jgi:hypothetical protein
MATIGSYATHFGTILAFPNGILSLGPSGKYRGTFIAKSILTGSYVEFWLDLPY